MVHPAVAEYVRHRNGQPLMYRSVGEMPLTIAKGFLFLLTRVIPDAGGMTDRMAQKELEMAQRMGVSTGFLPDGLPVE